MKVNDILEVSQQSNQLNSSMNRNNFNQLANNSNIFNSVNIGSNTAATFQQQTSSSGNDYESSPILLQVVPASLNETIPHESIRIDQIASTAPFSFKASTYAIVTAVDKSVINKVLFNKLNIILTNFELLECCFRSC